MMAFRIILDVPPNIFMFFILQGYTNSNNPFGDHNLRQTFTWHKVHTTKRHIHNVHEMITQRDLMSVTARHQCSLLPYVF